MFIINKNEIRNENTTKNMYDRIVEITKMIKKGTVL